jgi:Na+/citrate or Na+/malate symporter
MLLLVTPSAFSQVKEVPFTLDDRDRIIRTEEQIKSLRNEMNARFEVQNWGTGILVALMLFLLGYIIWDRRSALNPIQAKTIILEERVRKLEHVSKEQAKKDPVFAELLRAAGLL